MSYPPYQQGYGQNPPYGGTPYPTGQNSSSAPYPPYPNQSGIYAPSLGFKVDAPIFMPIPGYPPAQTNSPYPNTFSYSAQSNTPSYPLVQGNTSTSPYPPQTSKPSYPPQGSSSPYPPQGSSSPYPSQGRAPYPNTSSVYRSGSTASASYPSTNYGSAHVGSSYPSTHYHAPYSSGSISQHVSAPSKTGYPPGGSYQTNTTTYSSNTGHASPIRKMTPTVIPMNPFNARGDAEILRKAMKGFGTDEKAIISVVTRRSNAQRLQIAIEFKTLYGKDLIKDLKSETSGKFEDLLVALMTPLPQYYAKELHDAISGLGTDEDVLIEVLCTKSNNEIRTIRAAYHSMYGRSLEDDLIGDTSGTFKRLMVSLCNACRDESTGTNPAAAAKDAQDLLRAGELKLGTDESTFNMILCQRSYAQLRLIFEEYYRITGHDFENAIKNEFSGNSKEGLLAIVRSIRNLPGFFAKCLHSAIAGLGTNDRQLIRVIVTRCEIDMGEIKQNYLAQYGETLGDAIKGDTSGDYKKCLLALIGES